MSEGLQQLLAYTQTAGTPRETQSRWAWRVLDSFTVAGFVLWRYCCGLTNQSDQVAEGRETCLGRIGGGGGG